MLNKITIVIPAFNEEKSIENVLKGIKAHCSDFVEEIIVVDDGSTDDTSIIAAKAGVKVIKHSRNKGYGASLKTGIKAAQTELIATMDADGQHSVEDIRALYNETEMYDMVVGKRTPLIHSTLWRMPGKWLISLMANYILSVKVPDLNSGLRIFKRAVVLKYIHLCPSGFSFSTTITMALISRGYNVKYVPIKALKRVGKSTVSISTGFNTIILILRLASLFGPLRIFIPSSFFIAIIGVLWGIPYIMQGHGVSIGTMMATTTGILLFALGLICDQISQLRLERFE